MIFFSLGFWVAEAYEPYFLGKDPSNIKYKIIKESNLDLLLKENRNYCRKIIGTVALTRSKQEEESAWLRRMAVNVRYQRKGVAMALLNEVIDFCTEKGKFIKFLKPDKMRINYLLKKCFNFRI